MSALYRQYRPQFFREITGQDHVTETLQQAIQKDRVSHAYLFQGPRGTGKTTTARILAKRVNCTKPKGSEPCGRCPICVATTRGRNLDIIEIDAASNRGIDDVRALRESVGLAPAMSTYKVYIIDEVHMLSRDAFSALLKTLEEPVKHAIFILATTELHKVPATIASRCQVFRFRRASDSEMKERLQYILSQEKRSADDEVIEFITLRSDGCYRDAESLLGQILSSNKKRVSLTSITKSLGLPPPSIIISFLDATVQGDSKQALDIAMNAYHDGFDPEQFIQEVIRTARDGLLDIVKQNQNVPSFAQHEHAAPQLQGIIRSLIQATQDLAYVPQPIIALQLAILSACPTQYKKHPSPIPRKSMAHATVQPLQTPPVTTHSYLQKTSSNSTRSHPLRTSIDKITSTWSNVIQRVRKNNPVSATFLRACEPIQIEGDTIVLRVHFPLHRNFFERPENKKIVEKSISECTNEKLHIRCYLEENKEVINQLNRAKKKQEDELLKNVQEVFGT